MTRKRAAQRLELPRPHVDRERRCRNSRRRRRCSFLTANTAVQRLRETRDERIRRAVAAPLTHAL